MTLRTSPSPRASGTAHGLTASESVALLDELADYLRSPGQGIHTVTTGREAVLAATAEYLGGGWSPETPWRDHLAQLLETPPPVALLAIPCDTGAGIVRGAAWGPAAIRAGLTCRTSST